MLGFRSLLISFFLFFLGNVFAQRVLEATLLDGMTQQPVSGVHVYLDGTSIGTTTDSLGRFRLTVRNAMNASLVISHILYEKLIIPEPFRTVLPKFIYLEENVTNFEEVVISAKDVSRMKRREMLAIFRKQLLGYERSALSCKIMNEEDVVLIHDREQRELRAYAQKPIEIVNNYLKYRILWELVEFKISYADATLLDRNMQHVSIIGTVSFTDIGAPTENLRIRRRDVYNESVRRFFHLLANNEMHVDEFQNPSNESSFKMFELTKPTGFISEPAGFIKLFNQEKYFTVLEFPHEPSMKMAIVNSATKDSITGGSTVHILHKAAMLILNPVSEIKYSPEMYFQRIRDAEEEAKEYGYQYLKPGGTPKAVSDYREKMYQLNALPDGNSSKITFYTDTFLIDSYGNTNLHKNFLIENKFARQRLGDLLPSDYEDLPLGAAAVTVVINLDSLTDAGERIETYFLRQLQAFPQEKIYVHTDKSNYTGGETVWFRIYLADYATHNPSEAQSRYVYGELLNPADSLIQRVKIRQDSVGVFRGYFDLPANLAGGIYRLRFYTRYMAETMGEEYFFNRRIYIGHVLSMLYRTQATFGLAENDNMLRAELRFTNVKDGAPLTPQLLRTVNPAGKETFIPVNGQGVAIFNLLPGRDFSGNQLYIEYEYGNMLYREYIAVPRFSNDYNVSFHPEGGALSANTPMRVAFKALQSNGWSERVSGLVYSSIGDTVARFASNPLGMGSFSFTPQKGEQYTALCRSISGMEKRFTLPDVSENTLNLKIVTNQDRLLIQVVGPADVDFPDSMRLLVHCRGILYYNELCTIGKSISIRKDLLPSGVLQLLLTNNELNPISERLVFNLNGQDMAHVSVSTDKDNYRQREPIRMLISMASHDSIPLQGNFSVSVTDDSHVAPDTTVHILSSLLLSSELKGYVETPTWYFTDENIGEIDHLMLTQGWSRYDIAAVLRGDIHKPAQIAETHPEISGTVTSGLFLQNKGDDYYVILSDVGNSTGNSGAISGVQNGRFCIVYDEKPNGISYMLQLVFPPKSIRAEMQPDSVRYPPVRTHLPVRLDTGETGFALDPRNTVLQYASDDEVLTNILEEVVIAGKRTKGIHPLSPGRMQDRLITIEELSKKNKSAPTLYQYLMSVSDVNLRRDANGTLRARYRNGMYYYDYEIVVDGRWWSNFVITESLTDEEKSKYGQLSERMNTTTASWSNTNNGDSRSSSLPIGTLPSDRGVSADGKTRVTVENQLDRLLSMPISRIEEIEIVRAPAPPIILKDFGNMIVNDPLRGSREKTGNVSGFLENKGTSMFSHQGYLGTILITTKARNGGINDGKLGRSLKITPLGYQIEREFYSPAYETPEQQNETTPDLRSAIYWNSDVRTNEDGEAEINFYAADTAATYTVIIEGITNDGVLIRKTKKINRN